MKTFVLTVKCETAMQLQKALRIAAHAVYEADGFFDDMKVDDVDNQDAFKEYQSELQRTE